jgi:hypothetical protein
MIVRIDLARITHPIQNPEKVNFLILLITEKNSKIVDG